MPIFPGQKSLELSDTATNQLAGLLGEVVMQLDSDHSRLFSDIDVWWDWYEAKTLRERRSTPWQDSSNIVLPFTRVYSDALIARFFGSMTGSKDFWFGSSRNEVFRDAFLPDIPDFLNWGGAAGHEYDLHTPLLDNISEMVPIGSSVVALNWQDRQKWLFVPGKKNPQKVRLSRGPVLEHIPRENIMWEPGQTIQQSGIVVRQYMATTSTMIGNIDEAKWDAKAVEMAKTAPGMGPTSSSTVQANKLQRAGYDSSGLDDVHDIREIHVEWPFLKGVKVEIKGEESEKAMLPAIVVTYHPKSRQILRVIPKPYFTPDWTFYETYYRKRSGQGSSPGVAKILDHLQRGGTTMINQTIDAVTKANSIFGKTTDPDLKNQEIRPDDWLLLESMDDAEPFNFQKAVIPDIAMINLLKSFAESLVGISDPALGRETRMGGHPSPATNFVGQLQQGQILNNHTLKQLRIQYSRIGMDIATMYQQFETAEDGKVTRALGPTDGERLTEWMFPTDQPIHGNLELDINALSEVHNPQEQRQKLAVVDQMIGNYYARVTQSVALLGRPEVAQNPALKGVVLKSIDAFGANLEAFLKAADVDEWEKYVFDMNEVKNANGGIDGIREALGQAGQLQGVEEGGAVGPGGPSANGAQGGPPQPANSGLGGR